MSTTRKRAGASVPMQRAGTLPNVQSPSTPPPTPPRPKEHLSVSQLTMFTRCSLQWYYRYVMGWIEKPALALARGKAGHSAVEWNTKRKISLGVDQPINEILDVFSDSYDAETDVLEEVSANELGSTKDETVETLKVWRIREAPLVEPLGAEVEIELIVPPVEGMELQVPPVIGRIDEAQTRGTVDNKFRNRMPSGLQYEIDYSAQLDTYDAAMHQKGINLPSVGIRTFVPPLKTVEPRVFTTWRNPQLLAPKEREARRESIFHSYRTMWKAIKAGIFMRTNDPKTCAWCGYRDRCQSSLVRSDLDAIQIRQKEIA